MIQPTAVLHHFAFGSATLRNHSVISDPSAHCCENNTEVYGNSLHTHTQASTNTYAYPHSCSINDKVQWTGEIEGSKAAFIWIHLLCWQRENIFLFLQTDTTYVYLCQFCFRHGHNSSCVMLMWCSSTCLYLYACVLASYLASCGVSVLILAMRQRPFLSLFVTRRCFALAKHQHLVP